MKSKSDLECIRNNVSRSTRVTQVLPLWNFTSIHLPPVL